MGVINLIITKECTCQLCGSFIDFDSLNSERLCDKCTDEIMYDIWDSSIWGDYEKEENPYEEDTVPFHKDFYEFYR